jgi:(p)ppGpp synthase/HD superfamily hydrolase
MPSIWQADTIQKAWQFATVVHDGQIYAGPQGKGFPYIHHLSAVAMEVAAALQLEEERNADLAMQCALLHDSIEDTATAYEDLKNTFGKEVAQGVRALSKDEGIPDKQARMLDSLERIRQQPKEVWMVKLADRICNLSEPPEHWDANKRRAYRDEALVILQKLDGASKVLSDRLQHRIIEYGHFIK